MSERNKAQAARDQLFEPQIIVNLPGQGDAKSGLNVYTQALAAARTAFPNDGVAAHRAATRAVDRAARMSAAARAPSRASQEILLDRAFLEAFGGRPVRVETFSDRVIARGIDGALYKVPYTVSAEGVTFGAPQIVENLADEQQH
jgi:hypothetical protein